MLAQVTTFAIDGIEPRRVTVEVDVRQGLPAFAIVGLGDRSVREARERVRGAISNSGFTFPQCRVTVNLAPAYLRKQGPGFDLAIACGILAASGQMPSEALQRLAVFGELGGPNAGSFDWGLPFFYGRAVFTAIEGQSTPGGAGPYWAF